MKQTTVQHVTPITTFLLRWWFRPHEETNGIVFQDAQLQALLQTIATHEAIDAPAFRQARPAHQLALPDGENKLPVLLALLIWQLLNSLHAQAIRVHDPRFTDQFVLVAPDDSAREALLTALCGPRTSDADNSRDFAQADLVRFAELLMPPQRRDQVFDFVRQHAGGGAGHLPDTTTEPVITVTDDRVGALESLARLPHAMVFDDETRPPFRDRREDISTGTAWRRHLRRFASMRNGNGAQVLFTHPTPGSGRHRYTVSGPDAGTIRGRLNL